MKNIFLFLLVLFSLLISFDNAKAEDSIAYSDPDGVRVKFYPDGTMKSIISSAEAALDFGDRRDKIMAKKKAVMIAKAQIAKFLNEKINTQETQDSITTTIIKQTGGDKSSIRTTVDNQTEKISNSAEQLLKGVIVLSEDVNPAEKYVRVEVGINEKTMRAADTLKSKIEKNLDDSKTKEKSNAGTSQGREIKKSKMYDDF